MTEPQLPSAPTGQDDPKGGGHWYVLRDLVALQFKLALDGILDLLLSPVTIAAAIAGLIFSPDDPGKYFYRVLKFGHKSDRWINLYGAGEAHGDSTSSDTYVRKVEEIIKKEYDKGGVVKSLKDGTDSLIDRVRRQ